MASTDSDRQTAEENKVHPGPDSRPRSRARQLTVVFSLFLSLFTAALDFTITSPAIPSIVAEFHSGSSYAWIGSAYLLSIAASTPIWGKLSDIWGRKPLLLAAVAVFFLGSLLCAAAKNMAMFLGGRAVQGGGAGGVFILVNICITDIFEIRTRGLYLGLTSVVWALACGIGPVIGGALTQFASWRWNWWINLPCSALGFVVPIWLLDLEPNRSSFQSGLKHIDWLGSITILGVTILILLGLDFGGVTFPWQSPKVVCLIVFGVFMLVLFIYNEARLAKYPIIPLRLFKRRSNIAALLVCFCHGFVYISAFYFLPIFFQAVRGSSTLLSGILILPIAMAQCLTSIATGLVIKHRGSCREPIWLGLALMALGFGLFIKFDRKISLVALSFIEAVAGLGVGMNFQAPLIALQSLVEPKDYATATATFGFIRNIATSISVVVGGVIFQNGMQSQVLTLQGELGKTVAERFNGRNAEGNIDLIATLDSGQRHIVQDAYADALRKLWIVYVCVAAVGLAASLMVDKRPLPFESKSDLVQDGGEFEVEELQEVVRK
ncbi:MDR family MFS transporter [Aspergillus alliaceus]|uniref:MDR family MFS transporter n=1 Tax=Petromyces alliaceus TaxID=209559 RepID=UPI0012A5BD9A|nr:MFS transporter [Aspergillus alliaceus]KAB8238106.1 MFS transporter [Aspergillus alliaceus]